MSQSYAESARVRIYHHPNSVYMPRNVAWPRIPDGPDTPSQDCRMVWDVEAQGQALDHGFFIQHVNSSRSSMDGFYRVGVDCDRANIVDARRLDAPGENPKWAMLQVEDLKERSRVDPHPIYRRAYEFIRQQDMHRFPDTWWPEVRSISLNMVWYVLYHARAEVAKLGDRADARARGLVREYGMKGRTDAPGYEKMTRRAHKAWIAKHYAISSNPQMLEDRSIES